MMRNDLGYRKKSSSTLVIVILVSLFIALVCGAFLLLWLSNKFDEQKMSANSELYSHAKVTQSSSVSSARIKTSQNSSTSSISESSSSQQSTSKIVTNTDFVSKFGLKLISSGTSGLGEYDAGVGGLGGAGPNGGPDYSWVPTEENILEYGKRTIKNQTYTYYYVTPGNPNNKDLTIDSHGFYKIGDFLLARSATIPAGTVIHTYAGTVMVIDGSTANDFLDFAVDQASVEE